MRARKDFVYTQMAEKTIMKSIKLYPDEVAELVAIAGVMRLSQTDVIRLAIKQFTSNRKEVNKAIDAMASAGLKAQGKTWDDAEW